MDRTQLIARKHQVIAEIQRTRRQLEAARANPDRHHQRRVHQLEAQLDALMAEEARLRQQIDRSR
jgi:predicted aminopeptidase